MTRACRFLGISRQAFYQRQQRDLKTQQLHADVLNCVRTERLYQPRIGTRKLQYLLLTRYAKRIGRDRLFALLGEHRLLVRPRRAYHKTTDSHHRFRCHPNLLKTGPHKVNSTAPEQVWVADITYLPVTHGEAYLSLVTDAWSRKIVGYHVHDDLKASSVSQAYTHALEARITPTETLVHHSDRGIQYCAELYQSLHRKHGVTCSMTDGYDCYQNAMAERVNGIIKNEYLLAKPRDIEEAKQMVRESVEIYNSRRPHLALKYKTPDEVHRAFKSEISVNLFQD